MGVIISQPNGSFGLGGVIFVGDLTNFEEDHNHDERDWPVHRGVQRKAAPWASASIPSQTTCGRPPAPASATARSSAVMRLQLSIGSAVHPRFPTGGVSPEPIVSGTTTSWSAPLIEAGESPTEVRRGQPLRTVLPSSFFDFDFLPTPSWSPMGKAKQTFGGQRSVSYTGKYE